MNVLIIETITIFLVLYYVCIVSFFYLEQYDERKEFLLELIPFYMLIRKAKERWEDME